MKLIDKTPLQDEKGIVSFTNRIQGTLKYGLNWFNELEAQKTVIAKLDQSLDKNYTLIRNFNLPNSDIIIPMALVCSGGISVIYVSHAKGHFEAKGDQWNIVNNGKSEPAPINILGRIAQLTRAFQKYLEIHKVNLPAPIEAVLIAADPGAHVETMRPAARIVLSDGIKQYATTLSKQRPVWNVEQIPGIIERILNPPAPVKTKPTPSIEEPPSQPVYRDSPFIEEEQPFQQELVQDESGFNRNAFGIDYQEEPAQQQPVSFPEPVRSPRPVQRKPQTPKKKQIMGMSVAQLAIIAIMAFFACAVIAGLGYFLLLTQ